MRKVNRVGRWITWSFAGVLVGLAIVNALAGNVVASVLCSSVASWMIVEG